jgi:hypothetical protein
MAKVLIAESAWQKIIEEVNFFAADGGREAIIYPLFSLTRKSECMKATWEMLGLEDIDYFVVTHVHPPLRKFCVHTPVRAKFSFASSDEEQEFQADVQGWVQENFSKYPLLELGNVHSHPFSVLWTRPSSGGDQMDYARIHKMWQHMRQKRFVDTPLEIILCRNFFFRQSWKACCFGFDKTQEIVTLGKAEIISDDDVRVRNALSVPFVVLPEGISWQKQQLAEVPEIQSIDKFCFGWSTAAIKLDDRRNVFMHFSPQYPKDCSALVQMEDVAEGIWSPMRRITTEDAREALSIKKILNIFMNGGNNE